MKKMYFVHPLVVHAASTTPKTKELKVWLYKYDRSILDGGYAIQGFFEILKEKVELLNKQYPRSKPLKAHKYSFPRHKHWYFAVRYADDTNNLFAIHIDQIENIYFNISL